MLQKFIDYLISHVDKALYGWGAQGQHFPTVEEMESFIDRTNNSSANKAYAKKLLHKNIDDGIPIEDIWIFDCSGLFIRFALDNGLMTYDTTANGLYSICKKQGKKLSRSDVQTGDMVFKYSYSRLSVVHIGYCVDVVNGTPIIVHDKNSKVGTIKEPIDKSTWNRYGRPPQKWWNVESEEKDMLQYKDKSETVAYWQGYLVDQGYDMGGWKSIIGRGNDGTDGSFGNHTVEQTKLYQKNNGLDETGKVTISMLIEALGQTENDATIESYKDQITALIKERNAAQMRISAGVAALTK